LITFKNKKFKVVMEIMDHMVVVMDLPMDLAMVDMVIIMVDLE